MVRSSLFTFSLVALVAACSPAADGSASQGSAVSETPASDLDAGSAGAPAEPLRVELTASDCDQPGTYHPDGEVPPPIDVARDAYCGHVITRRNAPSGFVVLFGSSRIKTGPVYENARTFARLWTEQHGDIPVMTGGGPGLMEAGNRGAKEAGGKSLGFSTFFKGPTDKLNDFVTDGYMFSDFEVRERALLKYARAVVVYPGGVGTAWEFFMTLSEIQTKRLKKVPVVLVGSDVRDAVMPYLEWMKAKGTIAPEDIDLFKTVDSAEDVVSTVGAAI